MRSQNIEKQQEVDQIRISCSVITYRSLMRQQKVNKYLSSFHFHTLKLSTKKLTQLNDRYKFDSKKSISPECSAQCQEFMQYSSHASKLDRRFHFPSQRMNYVEYCGGRRQSVDLSCRGSHSIMTSDRILYCVELKIPHSYVHSWGDDKGQGEQLFWFTSYF